MHRMRHSDTRAKENLKESFSQDISKKELAGEKIESILTHAPGNNAPIGGLKVTTKKWMVRRASIRD